MKPTEYVVFPWIVADLYHYAQIESETPLLFRLKGMRAKTIRKDVGFHRCFDEEDARNLRDRLNSFAKRRNQLVRQAEDQFKQQQEKLLSEFQKKPSAQPPKEITDESHPLQ